MTLITNESQNRHEFREGMALILWFGWDLWRAEYMADNGTMLGCSWQLAHERARAMAEARMPKPSPAKELFK